MEVPGGKIEANKTPQECLKRELYDEFQVDTGINEFIMKSVYEYLFGPITLHAYYAWVMEVYNT